MKVVIIGATGLIGTRIAETLEKNHQVVRVGHSGGELRVDITSGESIERLFAAVGRFDALVCAAGSAAFGPFTGLSDEDFRRSLQDKLMGQVNLVRFGVKSAADGASFTLTSGVLADNPIPGSAAVSLVNGAIESFAKAAALEMPRGQRINVVSPPWATETLEKLGMDASQGTPVARFVEPYVQSLEGKITGQVLEVRGA